MSRAEQKGAIGAEQVGTSSPGSGWMKPFVIGPAGAAPAEAGGRPKNARDPGGVNDRLVGAFGCAALTAEARTGAVAPFRRVQRGTVELVGEGEPPMRSGGRRGRGDGGE